MIFNLPARFNEEARVERRRAARRSAFTTWYDLDAESPDSLLGELRARWLQLAQDAQSVVFPEFHRELRDAAGTSLGWLFALPVGWDGDANTLRTLSEYEPWRVPGPLAYNALALTGLLLRTVDDVRLAQRLWQRYRRSKLGGRNAFVLTAILMSPEQRGRGLSSDFVKAARSCARSWGASYILSPFRPSGYGAWKMAELGQGRRPDFSTYCKTRRRDGELLDPWLRILERHGMTMLRVEPRSFVLPRPLADFEHFRRIHRPQDWLQVEPDVWECGETPHWEVDRARAIARSVEPNVWGQLPLVDPDAQGSRPSG